MAPAALPATAVHEYRSTGAATNSGFWDSANPGGGGTDYSQQDAPQLALTDLAHANGAGAVVTSVTAGFTAAMVNNWCYIAGTGYNTGRYKVVSVDSATQITLCADPTTDGGAKSGGTCNVGGGIDLPTDALLELAVGGNVIYIKGGSGVTYTLSGAISIAADGTATSPVMVIGYNATRSIGGVCDGADRPTIAAAANGTSFAGDYWSFANLNVTTTASGGWSIGAAGRCRNSKVTNSSGTAGRNAFACAGNNQIWLDCEGISTNGQAFSINQAGRVYACYAHDSATGITVGSTISSIISCIIETCTTVAIALADKQSCTVISNTLDSTVDGITGSTAYALLALNNIISNMSSEGAAWTTQTDNNWWDYNDFFGNATDITNIADRHATLTLPGPNDFDTDPSFTNAAGGDFSRSATPDDGFGIRLGVG